VTRYLGQRQPEFFEATPRYFNPQHTDLSPSAAPCKFFWTDLSSITFLIDNLLKCVAGSAQFQLAYRFSLDFFQYRVYEVAVPEYPLVIFFLSAVPSRRYSRSITRQSLLIYAAY
jgi:hypothetical protein